MQTLMKLESLTKKYGDKYCLGPINLTIHHGETIALIGPNGAGKTTLFSIITGHIDASDGSALFNNQLVKPQAFALKRHFGYLPQDLGFPAWVTPIELLHYNAALHQVENAVQKIQSLLDKWQINDYQHRPLAACSHGMQKRVGLALSTLHNPSLLILDEPFSGLDLYHMKTLENLIVERSQAQQTTILSTHIIPYAARICDHVLIIKAGKIRALDSWQSANWETRITLVEDQFFKLERS